MCSGGPRRLIASGRKVAHDKPVARIEGLEAKWGRCGSGGEVGVV